MANRSAEIKQQLSVLSYDQLISIIAKLASKKEVYDYLLVNYLDKDQGEKDLFNQALRDIDYLIGKGYKGFSEQLRLANMLSACTQRINEFTQISKNKKLEADLLLYVLEYCFTHPASMFGTCFTRFDHKVGMMVKRLITIVTKKLHPDFVIEYRDKLNNYLKVLHRRSSFNDFIYTLPKSID